MNKRSILYGYQIQNGVLEIVAEEQAVVQQVFERYHAGGSYQSISEELNHSAWKPHAGINIRSNGY